MEINLSYIGTPYQLKTLDLSVFELDLMTDLIRTKLNSIDINDNPMYFEALDDLLELLNNERTK
jgi:hypothetical protein